MTAFVAEVVAWLQEWFRLRAPQTPLSRDQNFFQAGAIDSFAVIELIEELEARFAVRFTQDDFQDRRFSSIDGLSALLGEKRAS